MAWLSAKQDDAAAVGLAGVLPSGGCGSGEIGEILVTVTACTITVGRPGTAAGYGGVDSDETALLPGHE